MRADIGSFAQEEAERDKEIIAAPYMCGRCDATFASGTKLRRHCEELVNDCSCSPIQSFICRFCYLAFTDLDLYLSHCSKHIRVKVRHKCDQCDKTYARVTMLNEHKLTHASEHPFQCHDCNKLFTRKSGLTKHKRLCHDGQRPYKCQECGRTFTESSSLNSHMLIHTGEKPLQMCGVQVFLPCQVSADEAFSDSQR